MRGGINQVWARLMIEELVRSGVQLFCMSSGFRNAPLAMAAAQHEKAQVVTHYDERGTAFFALGYARATARPAAWITTSGSAVANGLPAVVEADADQVPMMLLTADRPSELRQAGANQTIDQASIFRPYVRWSFDMPACSEEVPPAFVLTTVGQACFRACNAPKGPVHLNCMFRAPLVAEMALGEDYLAPIRHWQQSREPFTRYVGTPKTAQISAIASLLRPRSRILVVAGRLTRPEDGAAVLRLASARGWPVYADINSQIRLGSATEVGVTSFDLILENPGFADTHAPEAVLYFGAPAVSGVLLRYLSRHRVHLFAVVHPAPHRLDPSHQVTHRIQQEVAGVCEALEAQGRAASRTDADWLQAWRGADERVQRALHSRLTGTGSLSEPYVAHAISRLLPQGHHLVLGNSMPVRDVNRFGVSGGARSFVAANRGASGIDGTLATAAGVAQGGTQPVTVLLGDLALLHDLNSLALIAALPVIVVVLNNDGGGIFHMLNIEVSADIFERCFGTPHGLHFEHAASQFGLRYARVTSRERFEVVYSSACAARRAVIIEIPADRHENHALRRALAALAAAAV